MQDSDSNLRTAAARARGDFDMMLAICKNISLSEKAAPEQIDAAKAARRALFSCLKVRSPTRDDVAEIRYQRLLSLL
jgi:hypothetical protein